MNAGRCGAVFCMLAGLMGATAHAQEYPTKPIRLIVAFTPGGSTDIFGRMIGIKLTEALGQQVIIDNRPGAGGTIGTDIAAKAAPDGYTLAIGHIGTLAVNPSLYPRLPYDPVKDFQPLTTIATAPSIMAVHPSLPVRTAKEFIALARAKPGQLSYGSAGSGTAAHLITAYFAMAAKIELLHVPYRGTSPALIDLMAGQITTVFTGVPGILPHAKTGKLRVIGVSTLKRLSILPDVPTIAESGLPNWEVTQWWGVLAPAGTPRPIVTKLHDVIVKALQSPEMRSRLAIDAAEPVGDSPEQFHAFIRSEIARWAPVIKASGAKPE